jgi:hypothetical protein
VFWQRGAPQLRAVVVVGGVVVVVAISMAGDGKQECRSWACFGCLMQRRGEGGDG